MTKIEIFIFETKSIFFSFLTNEKFFEKKKKKMIFFLHDRGIFLNVF